MNRAFTAAEMERRIATMVRARLPARWKVAQAVEPEQNPLRPDLMIEIESPDGRSARLVVEMKQTVERRDVVRLGDDARRLASGPDDVPVVAARYLSASVRGALIEDGLNYVDATGNMRIVMDSPRGVHLGTR